MKEIQGNIWLHHRRGEWVAITTNGNIRQDGACVMGRGVALQAARRLPQLPFDLGRLIRKRGNRVHRLEEYHLVSFPVKHAWYEKADLDLIVRSAHEIVRLLDDPLADIEQLYSVRPGCGNGGLSWADVKPLIASVFDDRVIIVEQA